MISVKKSFDNTEPELDIQYLKLSIIGIFSKQKQKKIKKRCKRFSGNTKVKLDFTSEKLSTALSSKDIFPNEHISRVAH